MSKLDIVLLIVCSLLVDGTGISLFSQEKEMEIVQMRAKTPGSLVGFHKVNFKWLKNEYKSSF